METIHILMANLSPATGQIVVFGIFIALVFVLTFLLQEAQSKVNRLRSQVETAVERNKKDRDAAVKENGLLQNRLTVATKDVESLRSEANRIQLKNHDLADKLRTVNENFEESKKAYESAITNLGAVAMHKNAAEDKLAVEITLRRQDNEKNQALIDRLTSEYDLVAQEATQLRELNESLRNSLMPFNRIKKEGGGVTSLKKMNLRALSPSEEVLIHNNTIVEDESSAAVMQSLKKIYGLVRVESTLFGYIWACSIDADITYDQVCDVWEKCQQKGTNKS